MAGTYRAAGGIDPGRALVGLLGSIALAVGLAWPYVLVVEDMSLPTLGWNALAALVYAVVLGLFGASWARLSRCRAPRKAVWMGLLLGLAADATSFGVAASRYPIWEASTLRLPSHRLDDPDASPGSGRPEAEDFDTAKAMRELMMLVKPPDRRGVPVGEFLRARCESGWPPPARGDLNVVGIGVVLSWILELALLCGAPMLAALATTRIPFCESCGRWARRRRRWRVGDCDVATLRTMRATETLQVAAGIPRDPKRGRPVLFELRTCPACESRSWLNASFPVEGDSAALRPTMPWYWLLVTPVLVLLLVDKVRERAHHRLLDRIPISREQCDAIVPLARGRRPRGG